MATLTTKKRKAIPKSEYGLPSKAKKGPKGGAPKGAYPMPDRSHAQNAKARAAQQYKKGNLTKSELLTIERKANKIIKRAGGKPTSAIAKGKRK
jgi:hypothetical protein